MTIPDITKFSSELKRGITVSELADKLEVSIDDCEVLLKHFRKQGYNIQSSGDQVTLSNTIIPTDNKVSVSWNGERILRFGLMGDTQINSKYTQLTYLHKYYDHCASEGIKTVYNTGDIDDGEKMRPGHEYELYTLGADEHVSEIVRVYPKRRGMRTYFITGNHDASYIKLCGLDIGYKIAEERSDMFYLGQSSAVIDLTPNCSLELRHPLDGTAYALSYKLQKMIEAMSGGEKPNILAVGHYHKLEYFPYRNVHAFQTGTFQSQTPWMRGKSIAAMIGGWIIEIHVNEDGSIARLIQEYIPFYKAIKNDYLNWKS